MGLKVEDREERGGFALGDGRPNLGLDGATFIDDIGSNLGSIFLQVATLPDEVFCVGGFEDTVCETV